MRQSRSLLSSSSFSWREPPRPSIPSRLLLASSLQRRILAGLGVPPDTRSQDRAPTVAGGL